MKNIMITVMTIGLLSPIAVFAADSASLKPDALAHQVHIRSLAASCAACHGTQGNAAAGPLVSNTASTTALAGVDKNHIVTKLMAYKSGASTATVMHRHAKGLSDEEIIALADYFSQQSANATATLKSQKLRAEHAH